MLAARDRKGLSDRLRQGGRDRAEHLGKRLPERDIDIHHGHWAPRDPKLPGERHEEGHCCAPGPNNPSSGIKGPTGIYS
jgi:hypothetical protein